MVALAIKEKHLSKTLSGQNIVLIHFGLKFLCILLIVYFMNNFGV